MEKLGRRRYYISYYKNFANTYDLYYAENTDEVRLAEEKGFTQISRKEAERKCSEEKFRRKYDPSFSHFASIHIIPLALFDRLVDPEDVGYRLNGYIYEK